MLVAAARNARSVGRRALACLALVCAVPAQAFPGCGIAMFGRAMNLLAAQQPARVCHGRRAPAGRRGLAVHSVEAQLKLPSQSDWADRGGGGEGRGGAGAGGGPVAVVEAGMASAAMGPGGGGTEKEGRWHVCGGRSGATSGYKGRMRPRSLGAACLPACMH